MDDIAEKLSSILNSDGGMDKLRAMAQSLLGNDDKSERSTPNEQSDTSADLLQNLGNIQGIMRIVGLLSSKGEDSRVRLLLALKPHLSPARAERVDKAVTLLKMASLLPILKEEGLLGSLF